MRIRDIVMSLRKCQRVIHVAHDSRHVPFNLTLYGETATNQKNKDYRNGRNCQTELCRISREDDDEKLRGTLFNINISTKSLRLTCIVTPMKAKKSNLSRQIMTW